MSIASAITSAQGKVADCYTTISNKGGTLPATQNLANMPTAISSIPSGSGSDTVPSYQIVNGSLTRRTDTYNLSGTEFSSVTSIGDFGLYYAFYGCTGITGNIDLSNVTSIGTSGCAFAFFDCRGITSADLSSVTSIGTRGLQNAFQDCTGLTSIDLSSVTSIASYGCQNAFYICNKLQTISFDSLKTTSFGNVNVFSNMFSNTTGSEATGGCTVHFPSNLQSTVSGLTGYPTFGGSSSYITLSFDLPATS